MTDQEIDEFLGMLAKSPTSARDMVRGLFAAHEAKAAPAVPQGERVATVVDNFQYPGVSNELDTSLPIWTKVYATPAAPSLPMTDEEKQALVYEKLSACLHCGAPSQEPPDVWPFITPHEVALRLGPQEVVLRFVTESETQRACDAIVVALREKEQYPVMDDVAENAARYVWLRDVHIGDNPEFINLEPHIGGLDGAIDALREKQAKATP